jgi:hypothetical protein
MKRYVLALLVLAACDAEGADVAAEPSACSVARLAILEQCEEYYDTAIACQDAAANPEDCRQPFDDWRWCVRSVDGFEAMNASGEFSAYDVVGYCDHDSPTGDRWCPEAEVGCEL